MTNECAALALARVKACKVQIGKARKTISREICSSGKLFRAAAELGEVDGYLYDVADVLTCAARLKSQDRVTDWVEPDIADQVLGCASLVELAASEVKVRVRGSANLERCVVELREIRRELALVAGNLTRVFTHVEISPDALRQAIRATELAQVLEEYELVKNRKQT